MAVRDVVQAAAGVGGGDKLYVEDVFSTYLYTGNSSTNTITNGIDLAGEGGLVWCKERVNAYSHGLYDTARGINKELYSDEPYAQYTGTGTLTAFNSDGFTLGASSTANAGSAVSWTFRKAPNFFDVVTWTGDGTVGREISHNLGSVPGCIIVKRIDSSSGGDWQVYHRGSAASGSTPEGSRLMLDSSSAVSSTTMWNNTAPTSTVFTVAANVTNGFGRIYVAYVFAHDAGGFGEDGTENIISCGSYEGNGTTQSIDIGFEPQWLLIKPVDQAERWLLFDTMRGLSKTSSASLRPDTYDAEFDPDDYSQHWVDVDANGFFLDSGNVNYYNYSARTYIYIAIRRGPMKTPESGTEVFIPNAVTVATNASVTTNFPVDMVYGLIRGGGDHDIVDRLRGISNTSASSPYLKTDSTSAELSNNIIYNTDNQTGYKFGNYFSGAASIFYSFKRAPSFMDVVAYTGTGVNRAISHNLNVAPEMIWAKRRNSNTGWPVYHKDVSGWLRVDVEDSVDTGTTLWTTTPPTDSVFYVGTSSWINSNASGHVAYLFATCPGVSTVSSYTGTGANLNVDCGFSAGARFVLIKRTDSTGDWYMWDSARGIVSGNDPYLLLNSTAAENTSTDYIDPLASGFTVTSSAPAALNASGGNYIFLAIA